MLISFDCEKTIEENTKNNKSVKYLISEKRLITNNIILQC